MMSPIHMFTDFRAMTRDAVQRTACVLVMLTTATFGFRAQAADDFASTKPT